ncbi:MAG: biotin/lipoyl-binding protein [Acidobacteria bacterium]|nr:biotin/lipoyl-binding protein [Acidobacteriota bacterium]
MKLEIVIDGRPRTLDLDEATPADAREVEPGVYSILIGERSYEVKIEPGEDCYYAAVNGRRYAVQVRDPRRLARARGALQAAGRQKVASPMPGKVVRVLVAEGAEVSAGQGLVVIEAMKMQNEIRSPKAGRVVALRVSEGAAVTGGETLAEVE